METCVRGGGIGKCGNINPETDLLSFWAPSLDLYGFFDSVISDRHIALSNFIFLLQIQNYVQIR